MRGDSLKRRNVQLARAAAAASAAADVLALMGGIGSVHAGNVFEKREAQTAASPETSINDASAKAEAMLRALGANSNPALDKADPNLGSMDLSKLPFDKWPTLKHPRLSGVLQRRGLLRVRRRVPHREDD